jgi:beta-phosphoglucomutase-like phosphatase (HAD superfamily)
VSHAARAADEQAALDAVMFDMDGLLVDTEPLWFEAESEIMARLGGTWSHADQAHLVGGSLARSAAYLRAKAGPGPAGLAGTADPAGPAVPAVPAVPHEPAELPHGAARSRQWPPGEATVGEWLVDAMVDRIAARGAALMPGAAELLADLAAAGLPCALVTSSQRRVMDAVLAHLAKNAGRQQPPSPGGTSRGDPGQGDHGRGDHSRGHHSGGDPGCGDHGREGPGRGGLNPQVPSPRGRPGGRPGGGPGLFDVTVCASDVTHAKPHPEPYLLAARLLDADPARCVVLEDAPNGVEAAEAAGCLVVAVPGVAAVPPRDGRVVVASLRVVSAGWLRQLAASRHRSAR